MASLIDTIYSGSGTLNYSPQYFAEHTILSSLDSDVDTLNGKTLEQFPRPVKLFHSVDFIPTFKQSKKKGVMLNYPVEYLNEINCTRLSLAELEVKVGCPMIILKNLNSANRVCNSVAFCSS